MHDPLGLPLAPLLLNVFLLFILLFFLFFVLIVIVFVIIDVFEGLPVSSTAILLIVLLVSLLLFHVCNLLDCLIMNDPVLYLLSISLMTAVGCGLHLTQKRECSSMAAFIQ